MLLLEIAILFALILFNGFMAMSELAVVSARPARLKARADQGQKGARRALALSADPGRFLSTVQIGITLVGVLSGAFSGATLGTRLSDWLIAGGVSPRMANPLGVGLVVALITYVSLIIGELVPKQLALKNAENIAIRVAPFMGLLSKIALPLVWLLDMSGRAVLALLGQGAETSQRVTDEEIRTLIAEAERSGTIESDERRMIAGVMRLADRKARAIMTPRGEVDWLDLSADEDTLARTLKETRHSMLPAGDGSVDELAGVVKLRDLLTADLQGQPLDVRAHVVRAPIVHDFADALDVLSVLREAEMPMALVHDEHGHFEGIITPSDILEAIAGLFRADAEEGELDVVQRADGSWLLPGSMPADEMADHLGIALPARRNYTTLAGFLLAEFTHLPRTGESVEAHGWRFEIVDLDNRRIDQVLASKVDKQDDGN
ncbi:hemolysin family protein [Nitratireductor sp. ZSWI3]|uniref:hemolysin family protein n=1 Tax=Nitratireductor sp. ZSWI3 TaxID=2966359 RepID=UPI00214FB89F|nr:hemolysin family protein [Nitratireductor sp. ZSWI3]MCR4268253.1 hemolysin family protein [Nitratireductor sp. ZSWI3]